MTWSPAASTHQWFGNPEPHGRGDRRTVGPVPLDQPDRLEASECFRVVEEAAVGLALCHRSEGARSFAASSRGRLRAGAPVTLGRTRRASTWASVRPSSGSSRAARHSSPAGLCSTSRGCAAPTSHARRPRWAQRSGRGFGVGSAEVALVLDDRTGALVDLMSSLHSRAPGACRTTRCLLGWRCGRRGGRMAGLGPISPARPCRRHGPTTGAPARIARVVVVVHVHVRHAVSSARRGSR